MHSSPPLIDDFLNSCDHQGTKYQITRSLANVSMQLTLEKTEEIPFYLGLIQRLNNVLGYVMRHEKYLSRKPVSRVQGSIKTL